MIDLSRSRAGLLAQIDAPDQSAIPVHAITDAQVVTGNAQLRLRGNTRAELLPLLKTVLSERFAAVPRPVIIRDLFFPLKHALGNAFRHGNGDDPARAIEVEVVLTRSGTFIAVTDGVRASTSPLPFSGSRSSRPISLIMGPDSGDCTGACLRSAGKTVAGRCCSALDPHPVSRRCPPGQAAGQRLTGAAEDYEEYLTLRRVLDPAWIRTSLLRELPEFRDGRAKLESCHPYLGHGPAGDDCGIRYVLLVSPDGQASRARILTGRLHEDEVTAAADFDAATRLHDRQPWKGLRIPEAVTRVRAEPKLVLYDFDPWMNLWQPGVSRQPQGTPARRAPGRQSACSAASKSGCAARRGI
jgi:hypothetical protein